MSRRMRKYRDELDFICKCKPQLRQNIIKNAPNDLINTFTDIAQTVLYKQIDLTSQQRNRLRKLINPLKILASESKSVKSKKHLLSKNKGGNILKSIWGAIRDIFDF